MVPHPLNTNAVIATSISIGVFRMGRLPFFAKGAENKRQGKKIKPRCLVASRLPGSWKLSWTR
jgi:hypothetical protein